MMNESRHLLRLLIVPVAVACLAVPARAQLERGSVLVSAGGSFVDDQVPDERIDLSGWSSTFALEKVFGTRWALGFSFRYRTESESIDDANDPDVQQARFSSLPAVVTGRMLFGRSHFVGYLGLGAGQRTARYETLDAGGDILNKQTERKFAAMVMAGISYFPSRTIFIDVRYSLWAVPDSSFDEDVTNVFYVGFGIQLYDW